MTGSRRAWTIPTAKYPLARPEWPAVVAVGERIDRPPIRSHRRPRRARRFWPFACRVIGDLAIFTIWVVVFAMAGALFLYGTWSR